MVTRTRGRDVQLRSFALSDMVRWGYSGLRNIKPSVGEKQAKGIPALHRAAKLRAEAVAKLQLYCWRGDGPTRERIDTVWQSRLFRNGPQSTATNPVQTRFSFWLTVEESLAWRGNSYIWKNVDPSSGRIVEWWALHPDQVTAQYDANGNTQYRVEVAPGYVDPVGQGKGVYHVGPDTILHVRGYGEGGQLTAPSPIEVFKQALELPIGRQAHEARVWRRGTAIQQAVVLPQNVGKEQAEQWREVWRANYEGSDGETTVVLGGGAEIKPIGMSLNDAQFAELADITVQDAARIMSVPANLLGIQQVNTRVDLEQDLMTFLRFFLEPELALIEESLYADPELFGGSQTYPGFDTSGFVRGDLATEATIIQAFVQAGIITPNEARHQLGYEADDDPNSDILQVTPVGGAENPGLKLPTPPSPDGPADTSKMTYGRLEEMMEELRQEVRDRNQRVPEPREPVHVHMPEQSVDLEPLVRAIQETPPPVVNVEPPTVEVRVPEQAAPVVNVNIPEQPAPVVNVMVPEQAPPVVHVAASEQPAPVVHVNVPEAKAGRKKVNVERNPQGFITGLTSEDED